MSNHRRNRLMSFNLPQQPIPLQPTPGFHIPSTIISANNNNNNNTTVIPSLAGSSNTQNQIQSQLPPLPFNLQLPQIPTLVQQHQISQIQQLQPINPRPINPNNTQNQAGIHPSIVAPSSTPIPPTPSTFISNQATVPLTTRVNVNASTTTTQQFYRSRIPQSQAHNHNSHNQQQHQHYHHHNHQHNQHCNHNHPSPSVSTNNTNSNHNNSRNLRAHIQQNRAQNAGSTSRQNNGPISDNLGVNNEYKGDIYGKY